MAADFIRVLVGTLDISVVGKFLAFPVGGSTAGTFTCSIPPSGKNVGSWSCSIKRGIGNSVPQAFPIALAFTSSAIVQPATDAQDLSGTDMVYFTTDTAGTAGLADIWAVLKADK